MLIFSHGLRHSQEKKQLRTRTPWDGRALSGVDLTDAEVAPPAAAAAAAAVAARAGGASLQYSSEQLDLLACVFTAVKLLYSFGARSAGRCRFRARARSNHTIIVLNQVTRHDRYGISRTVLSHAIRYCHDA